MKKVVSSLLALCLALTLCTPAFAVGGSLDHFKATASYTNQFRDVSADAWYRPTVKTCYEYGLMKGASASRFNPKGTLSVAEALVMADRVHEIYTTGKSTLANGSPWYQPYVDYAMDCGVIRSGDFSDYNAKVTRQQMAYIFRNALPDAALPSINSITALPDVDSNTAYSREIFDLYNAGVLTGSDVYGTCKPGTTITRSEAAAIIARMALPDMRQKVVLMVQRRVPGTNIRVAVPKTAVYSEASGGHIYTDQDTQTATIAAATSDPVMKGLKTDDFSAKMMNDIITQSFAVSGLTVKNIRSNLVKFGTLPVYYSTVAVQTQEGVRANVDAYTYLENGTCYMVGLTDYSCQNGQLIHKMGRNLTINGYKMK